MKILMMLIFLCSVSVIPAEASELTAPEVPASGWEYMPAGGSTFEEGVLELIEKGISLIAPELEKGLKTCFCLILSVIVLSVLGLPGDRGAVSAAAVVILMGILFREADSMVRLASETVWELCEYGKLLCPVMTAALAAQGYPGASAAMYTGTMLFTTILGSILIRWLTPLIYIYMAFAAGNCALGEELFRKLADGTKALASWMLKVFMMVFTTYMSITGVVSGSADMATLKAAKLTISTAVPVIGGILSDASESVIAGMGVVKNTAGVYGILAALAVCLGPFITMGVQYLLLKATGAFCSLFAGKNITGLLNDMSSAMGLLLAMIAAGCMLILVSTVCYLKGVP